MKAASFLFISLFLLLTSTVHSQENNSSVRIGVKAGVNIANVSIKSTSSANFIPTTKSSVGGTAGVFATLPVSSSFSIQPELLYSMLGCKLGDQNITSTLHANYLVLPLLAKYNIKSSGFGVYVGPQLGILLSAKGKTGGETTDVKQQFKTTDVSGIIGAEYMFPAGLNISGRYQLGLSNIEKDPSAGESAKNRSITFTVGFSF